MPALMHVSCLLLECDLWHVFMLAVLMHYITSGMSLGSDLSMHRVICARIAAGGPCISEDRVPALIVHRGLDDVSTLLS